MKLRLGQWLRQYPMCNSVREDELGYTKRSARSHAQFDGML